MGKAREVVVEIYKLCKQTTVQVGGLNMPGLPGAKGREA